MHDANAVDLLLVLAADVSSSMDDDELQLLREGHCSALIDRDVLGRVVGGLAGAVGVAFIEWSGLEFQRTLLPWARIASPADAAAWAKALTRQPLPPLARRRGTSISSGIGFALTLLTEAPWPAVRRVIDVAGDGVNNSGGPVEEARDAAMAQGVTINGLVIEGADPNQGGVAPPGTLADYYRDSVIGGDGAFVLATTGIAEFAGGMRRKLIQEIAAKGCVQPGPGTHGAAPADCRRLGARA